MNNDKEQNQAEANRRTTSSLVVSSRQSRLFPCAVLVATLMCPFSLMSQARSDTLQLKDGTALQGTFAGGDAQTIRFTTAQGLLSVPRNKALVLTFTPAAPVPSTPPKPKPAPVPIQAPARPQQAVTIPAGTTLMISTTSQVTSQDKAGRRFTAKLASNLMAGGIVVAPAGTTVYGRVTKSGQAGRLIGKSELELNLTDINIGGKMYPLMTTNFQEAGKGSFRKTARNAGLGALIGGAFGDSDDAKKGAAIGVGVSVLRKGDSVTVPPGAMLEFRMTQPLTISP
ncbi:MAG: hypothetical protein ACYSWQ_22580 [Planctomycetota bacterium]|jgi:hypothetical protein